MHVATLLALRSITTAGWARALLTVLPQGEFVTDDTRNLAMSVAIVGSLAVLIDWNHSRTRALIDSHQRPAFDVYETGKRIGREQLLAEQRAGETVVLMEDRRQQLHAVAEDERAVGGGRWLR